MVATDSLFWSLVIVLVFQRQIPVEELFAEDLQLIYQLEHHFHYHIDCALPFSFRTTCPCSLLCSHSMQLTWGLRSLEVKNKKTSRRPR